MSAQRSFLLRLFRLLEEHQLEYCATRNYETLFEASESDVDLMTAPRSVPLFLELCRQAASENNYHFVQSNRFVNHSFIFWNEECGFIRIDVETGNRWKIFHVLGAAEILRSRRKFSEFFVPSAEHEAIILLTQSAWMGSLTERYSQRLHILQQEIPPERFSVTLHHAFSVHSLSLTAPDLPQMIRRGLLRKTFSRPSSFLKTIGFLFNDCSRLWQRMAKPCGVFFRTRTTKIGNYENFLRNIEFLFPKKKSTVQTSSPTFLQLLRGMFKGGLVVEILPVKSDEEARTLANRAAKTFFPRRTFVCAKYVDGSTKLAHVFSGAMTSTAPDERWPPSP